MVRQVGHLNAWESSDSLYSHFHISLAGVQDIQLLENAARPFNRRCVKCVEKDATMIVVHIFSEGPRSLGG